MQQKFTILDEEDEEGETQQSHAWNGGSSAEATSLLGASAQSSDGPQQTQSTPSPRTKYALMASYGLASWAWRSWDFAVALLLIKLYPSSLTLLSLYGLVDNLVRVCMGSRVGTYVDRRDISASARNCYLFQNACIGVSAASAAVLFSTADKLGGNERIQKVVYWLLIALMIACGAASSLGSMGVRIAVENKAVKALYGHSPGALAGVNAGFRAVDLTCLLAAPILVGLLMTFVDSFTATLLLAGYALVAWAPEILLLGVAVRHSSALGLPKDQEGAPQGKPATRGTDSSSLALYWRQSVLLANLGLAMLYCTVLSLGFLMTSFLHWAGMTEAEISGYRGIGALCGIGATALFPSLVSSLGLSSTGLLGICFQLGCLLVAVLPISWAMLVPSAAGDSHKTGLLRLLVLGVGLSRMGLWTYDLSVTQLNQDLVPTEDLGAVCGVQSSIQAASETASYLVALYLSDPTLFSLLMLGSLGVTATAALLYTIFYVRQRTQTSRRQEAASELT